MEYEYQGVVYTVNKLCSELGLSKSGAYHRLKRVIAGDVPPASLIKPRQPRPKSNSKIFVEYQGVIHTVKSLSRDFGLSKSGAYARLKKVRDGREEPSILTRAKRKLDVASQMRVEHDGVVYTVESLQRDFGLSKSGAYWRLSRVLEGKKHPSTLALPRIEQSSETPEQLAQLAEFDRLTANDDCLLKKYPSSSLCSEY